MKLDIFLSHCGLTKSQVQDGLQLRTLGNPDSGAAADVERVDDDRRSSVVVTVWEWQRELDGTSRQRVGRLAFDLASGALLSAKGHPDALAQMIAGMEPMVE